MGLFKLLLTGEDEEWAREQLSDLEADGADVSLENEVAADNYAFDIGNDVEELRRSAHSHHTPEEFTQAALQREADQTRYRDELVARVGQLHLAVESLLRLFTEKGVITDRDLRQMEGHVDREDGVEDGEFHPGQQPLPSHCPQCEAKLTVGKRMCVFCGHRFDVA